MHISLKIGADTAENQPRWTRARALALEYGTVLCLSEPVGAGTYETSSPRLDASSFAYFEVAHTRSEAIDCTTLELCIYRSLALSLKK